MKNSLFEKRGTMGEVCKRDVVIESSLCNRGGALGAICISRGRESNLTECGMGNNLWERWGHTEYFVTEGSMRFSLWGAWGAVCARHR